MWKTVLFWPISPESLGALGWTLFCPLGTRRTGMQGVPGPMAAA